MAKLKNPKEKREITREELFEQYVFPIFDRVASGRGEDYLAELAVFPELLKLVLGHYINLK